MSSQVRAARMLLHRTHEVVLVSLAWLGDLSELDHVSYPLLRVRMSELQDEVGKVWTSGVNLDLSDEEIYIRSEDREMAKPQHAGMQWGREHFREIFDA